MSRTPPRRRQGLGILAMLAIGAALFVGVSIISTGGRGLWFTDDGFLGRPRAPESREATVASPPIEVPPTSPASPDLASLAGAVRRAQQDLEAALEDGDPQAIQAAQEALALAQRRLDEAR